MSDHGGGHGHAPAKGGGHAASHGSGGGGSLPDAAGAAKLLVAIFFLVAILQKCEKWQEEAPLEQCTTPCVVTVEWSEKIRTGGRPVWVKFYGKEKTILLSGRENEWLSLDEFAPGEAEFTSPDGTPVRVQIFLAR